MYRNLPSKRHPVKASICAIHVPYMQITSFYRGHMLRRIRYIISIFIERLHFIFYGIFQSLADNRIGVEGLRGLCSVISRNRFIRKLNLSSNALGDGAADVIADFIEVNKQVPYSLVQATRGGIAGKWAGGSLHERGVAFLYIFVFLRGGGLPGISVQKLYMGVAYTSEYGIFKIPYFFRKRFLFKV